jgi:hypothetical protein
MVAALLLALTGTEFAPSSRTVGPDADLNLEVQRLKPGDTLVLKGGTYRLKERLTVRVSGEPDKWLTIMGERGTRPVLDVDAVRPSNLGEASWTGGIDLDGQSDIRLVNLEVRNSYGFGVRVNQCKRVDLCGIRSHRSFGPGIGVWNSEAIRVLGCEVTRANAQEMRLFGSRDRECPHEAISIAGVDGFEVAYNQVHDTEKEGIDVKEISRRGIVHHNWVHHLHRQAFYADAWFGELFDVEFASNLAHDAEWGYVVSVEHGGSSLRDVRIHHNIAFQCRASGVYFGTWGGDGPRSGIQITNNTLVGNGRPVHWAGPTGNIDLRSRNFRDVLVEGNRCAGGGAFEFASLFAEADFASRNLNVRGNFFAAFKSELGATSPYGDPLPARGMNTIQGDPGFVNAGQRDFRLVKGALAPATGALPNGARRLPPVKARFPGRPQFRPDLSGWPEVIRS